MKKKKLTRLQTHLTSLDIRALLCSIVTWPHRPVVVLAVVVIAVVVIDDPSLCELKKYL